MPLSADERESSARDRRKEKLERKLSHKLSHKPKSSLSPSRLLEGKGGEGEDEGVRAEDDPRRRVTRMGALKAIIATKKFRGGLKKRRQRRLAEQLLRVQDERREEEVEAVEAFRKMLLDEGGMLLPQKHDDYHTILRFLKARKFDLEKTKVMWENWLNWREEFGTDDILETFSFPEASLVQSFYPQAHHGVDRQGRPVYIELVGQADAAMVLKHTTLERLVRFHVQQFERTMRTKFPACSIQAGRVVNQTTTVMDVKGMGYKNFTQDARNLLATLSKIDSDYFPETLHRLFVLNAGPVFRAIWSSVKGMMDPKTAAKVQVLGANRDKLFEAIDPSQLPSILGGTCTCEGVEGGCLRSDRGPWQDPAIMKVVQLKLTGGVGDSGEDDLEERDHHSSLGAGSSRAIDDSETETASDTDAEYSRRQSSSSLALTSSDIAFLAPVIEEFNRRPPPKDNNSENLFRPSRFLLSGRKHSYPPTSTEASSEDESGPLKGGPYEDVTMDIPYTPAPVNTSRAAPVATSTTKPTVMESSRPEKSSFSTFTITIAFISHMIQVLLRTFRLTSHTPDLGPSTNQRDESHSVDVERGTGGIDQSSQIMQRVQHLEERMGKFTSIPPTPTKGGSQGGSAWPDEALERVRTLEMELAETKKSLKEILAKQEELLGRMERRREREFGKKMLCFG